MWHNGHRQTILVMGSLLTCLSHPSLLTFLSLDSENSFWDSIVFSPVSSIFKFKKFFLVYMSTAIGKQRQEN